MFRNYLKIALRNLWRNRVYTALNIVGLSIGLCGSWLVFRMVSYELAFDQQHPNPDRTFRVVSRFMTDGRESGNSGVPMPMIPLAQHDVAGIELAVPYLEEWSPKVLIPQKSDKPRQFRDVALVATDASYFDLFGYEWLAGNPESSLAQPNSVVLTQSRAAVYFPDLRPEQVAGQTLVYFDTVAVTVRAVVKDPTEPSSFASTEWVSASTLRLKNDDSQWGGTRSSNQLLIRLTDNSSPDAVLKTLNKVSARKGALVSAALTESRTKRWHLLQPLQDVHFDTAYGGRGRTISKRVLYSLTGLAGFILLLAIINYINLTSAQVPQRAREIGIRKTLGSGAGSLLAQFFLETLFVTILALGAAFGLAQVFLGSYADLLPADVSHYHNLPQIAVFLIVLVPGVSMLSAWYPGWLVTRFQPVAVLRGQAHFQAVPRITLRKSLIVFQFLIAQVFIIGALLVGQQLHFVLQHDMGFDQEALVTVTLPFRGWENPIDGPDKETFRSRIAALPTVAGVSLGDAPAQNVWSNDTWNFAGKRGKVSLTLYKKIVDTAYVGLYKMRLLAGRSLTHSDTTSEYVINESALRKMGLTRPQEAVGQLLTEEGGSPIPIVGVVADFHILSLRDNIPPVVLLASKEKSADITIRLASSDPTTWQTTLNQIATYWQAIYPDEPFAYQFYDQRIAELYDNERKLARVINLATGVAIFLSCLGLFGLATITALQRTKEIGVRKVLGASVTSIVALLSKDFLKLVLIAIVIASPIAWYATNRWLQDFAYKIDIEWWVFALAGLLAIGIALLTVSFQSIRAALVNPVKSLRSE